MFFPFAKLVARQEGIFGPGHLKEAIYASVLRITAVRVEPLEGDKILLKNSRKNHAVKRVGTDEIRMRHQ